MAQDLPNPPPASSPSDFNNPAWQNWFARLAVKIRQNGQILWSQISGTPTTLAGYGVTNAILTGVPTAPTAATGTNTTQLATTAFVQNDINSSVLLWIETY